MRGMVIFSDGSATEVITCDVPTMEALAQRLVNERQNSACLVFCDSDGAWCCSDHLFRPVSTLKSRRHREAKPIGPDD